MSSNNFFMVELWTNVTYPTHIHKECTYANTKTGMIVKVNLESVDGAGGTVLEAEPQILHTHPVQGQAIHLVQKMHNRLLNRRYRKNILHLKMCRCPNNQSCGAGTGTRLFFGKHWYRLIDN